MYEFYCENSETSCQFKLKIFSPFLLQNGKKGFDFHVMIILTLKYYAKHFQMTIVFEMSIYFNSERVYYQLNNQLGMNEAEEKAKKMKQQVQLLKKKYLKKNGPKETLASPEQSQKQKNILNDDGVKFQANNQQKKEKQQPLVTKNIKTEEENKQKQSQKQSQWSLKNMMKESDLDQQKKYVQQQEKEFYEEKFDQNDPFRLKSGLMSKKKTQENEKKADAQFADFEEAEEKNETEIRIKAKKEPEVGEACKKWKISSRNALSYLLFDEQLLLRGQKDSKQVKLPLVSQNPSFPGIVENLALQFIFKNANPLTQEQKDVVYEMAINYFSPSPKILSDVLLLCIVKIGPKCLKIYADQILSKIQYYFQRILIFKTNYLLPQEIDGFVSFCSQKIENMRREGEYIQNKWFFWLLLLKPMDNFIHQFLLSISFSDPNDLFIVFCILEPVDTNLSLSLLYLRCVDELAPTFSKYHIIENVIQNFKKMKVPEPLYKPVKSLKLKLIRSADSSGILKKPSEEEKGFMNYLNDKMGKLKGKFDSSMMSKSAIEVYFDRAVGEYRAGN